MNDYGYEKGELSIRTRKTSNLIIAYRNGEKTCRMPVQTMIELLSIHRENIPMQYITN